MRVSFGTISLTSSTCLPLIAGERVDKPVMLPSGRARLATKPEATGSLSKPIIIGVMALASLSARVGAGPPVTMTSTGRCASSDASLERRSLLPSANRDSMTRFFPSTHPSARTPWRSASRRAGLDDGYAAPRKPMRRSFSGCCASTITATARSTTTNRIDEARAFLIGTHQASPFSFLPSLDHFIRPLQHAAWHCETNFVCRLEVDDEFKLRRLLHRQITRFGTFQYLVHVCSRAPIEVIE